MTNILISGGCGFVGSHLAEALIKQGHQVTIFDNLSTGKIENVDHLTFAVVQIRDVEYIQRCLDEFDVVFHLAAKPFSKAKMDWFAESDDIFHSNTVGTFNLLRLIKPSCHFIAVSSASVYGEGQKLCEDAPFNPKSAYGYSKTVMEHVISFSPRRYTILRPATIIGSRGRCFPNRLIWSAVHNEVANLFAAGRVLRDIIDVRDVVSALIRVMDTGTLGVYNLGSNREFSGLDLAYAAKEVVSRFGLESRVNCASFVPEDFVRVSTLCSDKLCKVLGWGAVFSLGDSLEEIVKFYLGNDVKEPPSWDSL